MCLRTSSKANVGEDKDSEPRQRERCRSYATRKGWLVAVEFRDPAASGTDALIARKGFADCVAYCSDHKVRHIVIESGDRLARNLVVQETGLELMEELGLEIISAENETQFKEPSAVQRVIIFCPPKKPR